MEFGCGAGGCCSAAPPTSFLLSGSVRWAGRPKTAPRGRDLGMQGSARTEQPAAGCSRRTTMGFLLAVAVLLSACAQQCLGTTDSQDSEYHTMHFSLAFRSIPFSSLLCSIALASFSAHDQGTVILVVPLVKSERSTQVRSRVGKKNSIETRSSVAASVLRALMDQWQNAPPTWGQSDDPCGESPWEGVTCGGDKVISM